MKFGKIIQAQQVPGWSPYYLDYKFLKKIISSLAANRPASEAAALARGVRPSDILTSSAQAFLRSPSPSQSLAAESAGDIAPPPILASLGSDEDQSQDFQAHKAAFFFKLERELEKINTFYLQREAELKLRLETLLSKRRAAAMRGLPDPNGEINIEWSAVAEGFRLLERDLGKLQQFIEINATGFRKILKKFDKRSRSTTKELYLKRQVDVQPVFNRPLISELADTVAACLLDLTDLSAGLKFEGPAANDIFTQILAERPLPSGPYYDLEHNLRLAIASSDTSAIQDCVKLSEILSQSNGAGTNVARILWNLIIEAPLDLADLILTSLSTPFNFCFIDDINGRTCLHEATIAGAPRLVDMCLQNGVQHSKTDLYERTALHYAAMHGHASICQRLLDAGVPPNTLDRDNYSPLIYATLRGSVECVTVLLTQGVPVQPTAPLGDLIPLSLACQAGHVDIVNLLLRHGAECLPNSNGEYPMHLAVREGHADICKLLLHLEGWDTPDKYHDWTPLFHAARYGRVGCVELLLQAGARVKIMDELGHLSIHYAAWYGHHKSLAALLEVLQSMPGPVYPVMITNDSPMSDVAQPPTSEIDLIPSLALPPPIMPHRVYGHNYLDRQHLVQVSIGHKAGRAANKLSVRLHHRVMNSAYKDEHLLATAPLKLVMTCPNVTSAPYSVTLPQRNEDSTFSFQVPSLDALLLEFSIYPNFGTKTLGRAVALPSLFTNLENGAFNLPILDNRLHVVGEVDFEVNVITAFEGVTLEVGGDVETYWKSLRGSPVVGPQLSTPRWPHRSSLISSAHTSPATYSVGSKAATRPLTISSLQGNFISVTVQVTRDLEPVVYAGLLLPENNFELTVSDVTLAQVEALAKREGKQLEPAAGVPTADWPGLIERSMVSLAQLLKVLPPNLGISIDLAYPSKRTSNVLSIGQVMNLNTVVDSVLRTIYQTSASLDNPYDRRRIVFASFSPDVCAALNWKQPNYPVFFASLCGKNTGRKSVGLDSDDIHLDHRNLSVGAAVEFAKVNNMLGIFVDADLLIQVPSLIQGIRNAGLLVGIYGSSGQSLASSATTSSGAAEGNSVDAYLGEGMVMFVDHGVRDLM